MRKLVFLALVQFFAHGGKLTFPSSKLVALVPVLFLITVSRTNRASKLIN